MARCLGDEMLIVFSPRIGIRKHISVPCLSVVRNLTFSFPTEGTFLAQYKVLRENGHSPLEAFNETVEEATQTLFLLIGANG